MYMYFTMHYVISIGENHDTSNISDEGLMMSDGTQKITNESMPSDRPGGTGKFRVNTDKNINHFHNCRLR